MSDAKTCAECGAVENVVEHHIQYEPEETVDLCRSCHRVAHENEDHEYHPVEDMPDGFQHEQDNRTAVEVSDQTWKRLNSRKQLGQSMDDVVGEALDAISNEAS
jgi:hypothetical protein